MSTILSSYTLLANTLHWLSRIGGRERQFRKRRAQTSCSSPPSVFPENSETSRPRSNRENHGEREPTEILLPSFPRHAYNASRNISIGNSPYEIFERNNVRGRRAYRVPDDCLSIIRGQPLCLPSSRFMPFLVCTTDTHAEGWNYYYQRNFVPRYLAFESMM